MHCKTYIYKTCDDGTQISADVYSNDSTPETATAPKPIALLIHGGGWVVGSRTEIPQNQIQLLLNHGFVAVSIDYRLCPTISLHDGPITDTKDALLWCQTKLPHLLHHDAVEGTSIAVDASRIVVVGWSAGGHLALMLSQLPDPPSALLLYYPATGLTDPFWHTPADNTMASSFPSTFPEDVVQQIFSEQPPPTSYDVSNFNFENPRVAWFLHNLRQGTAVMACIGDGNIDRVDPRTWYANPTPDASGAKTFPPLMVIHGDQDELVPIRLSMDVTVCVKRQGSVAELEAVKGVGHGFDAAVKVDDPVEVWESVKKGYEFLTTHI